MGKKHNAFSNSPVFLANGFDETAFNNMFQNNKYLTQLMLLAHTMFEWKNLPREIDPKFIEWLMLTNGRGAFWKNRMGKFAFMSFVQVGQFDWYYEPANIRVQAPTGFNKSLNVKDDKVCILYNNAFRQPIIHILMDYAEKLMDLQQTMLVNLRAQKTPVLIKGNIKQMLSLKQMYQQYDGNIPFIFGIKDGDENSLFEDSFDVLKTDAPFIAPQIDLMKSAIWNEAMSFVGVDNVDTQKRERMVNAEASGNKMQVELMRQAMLWQRRQCVELFNEYYAEERGVEVEVNLRVNVALPNNGGGFTKGFDDENLEDAIQVQEEANNVMTGGSEEVG